MYDEKEKIFHQLMEYLYENNIDFSCKVYLNIENEVITKHLIIDSKHVTIELHAPNKDFNVPACGKLIAYKEVSRFKSEEWPGLSFELIRDNLLK